MTATDRQLLGWDDPAVRDAVEAQRAAEEVTVDHLSNGLPLDLVIIDELTTSTAPSLEDELRTSTALSLKDAREVAMLARALGLTQDRVTELAVAFGAVTSTFLEAFQRFSEALSTLDLTALARADARRPIPYYVRPQFTSAYRGKPRRAARRSR